jgi:hypothetical protein
VSDWLHGWVRCASCWHRWMAVRPVGTRRLECPGCHRFTAVTDAPQSCAVALDKED